ncbi:MAG: aldo/keto reductase [Anaerolineae bacterium]|nr:aldo/keto reductase [Anaerolineae bacterium]
MEYRLLGKSGLKVPVLSFGTGTFGGGGDFWRAWGTSDVTEATRLVDLCMDAGVTLFDTADVYSRGLSEEILGKAIEGRRNKLLISTKTTFRMSDDPTDVGSSRFRVLRSCEASLRRLNTDHIDIYTMHGFDAQTPVEETLRALDDLVSAGKVRYLACSNFSGWHLMKSLAASDKHGWARYVGQQVYYNLMGRELEWELIPLGLDQGVGTLVWGPLGNGKLTGKIRRGQPVPEGTRIAQTGGEGTQIPEDVMYNIIDAVEAVAQETGKSMSQVAINWLLQRPTISTVIIGARNEQQLKENLGAVGWTLTPEQIAKLDKASQLPLNYPYWHQAGFECNPLPVKRY